MAGRAGTAETELKGTTKARTASAAAERSDTEPRPKRSERSQNVAFPLQILWFTGCQPLYLAFPAFTRTYVRVPLLTMGEGSGAGPLPFPAFISGGRTLFLYNCVRGRIPGI